jgi:GNAT superfamily N-acetyltransferase
MEFVTGQTPDMAAVRRLYDDAGWIAYTSDMDTLERALRNSLYLVCAYENGELCGLLRAVGDGCTILYIQDILVMHDHRRAGIGRTMVEMLMAAYPGVRQRVLLTDETPEMHGFYESLGFFPCQQVGLTAFYYIGTEPQ